MQSDNHLAAHTIGPGLKANTRVLKLTKFLQLWFYSTGQSIQKQHFKHIINNNFNWLSTLQTGALLCKKAWPFDDAVWLMFVLTWLAFRIFIKTE